MCGRFAFYSPSEATAALFGVEAAPALKPRYNIAPTQMIAAVRVTPEDTRELAMLRWGLVPFWAKDPSIGNRMINARAETVAEKPSFRAAYRKRRCLVLADGFYEWRKEHDGKTPYFISLASGTPFAFAGLWEDWRAKDTDESLQSATIITTTASKYMSTLHDRMPVVLEQDAANRWLGGDEQLLFEIVEQSPEFRAWPVDRRVNNAKNEGAELVEPVGNTLSG
ncbi:MAG: SOS response-associated peptidase [Woeseiaceae bacterium]